MKSSPASGTPTPPRGVAGYGMDYPLLALACLLAALALPQPVPLRGERLPAELVGNWNTVTELAGALRTGSYPEADPDDWQPLALAIGPDGVVTGAFGGARVLRAQVEVERGWLGRWLGRGPSYLIRGELEGPVTPRDAGGSRRFALPCRLEAGALLGVLTLAPHHPISRPLSLQKSPAAVATRRP